MMPTTAVDLRLATSGPFGKRGEKVQHYRIARWNAHCRHFQPAAAPTSDEIFQRPKMFYSMK